MLEALEQQTGDEVSVAVIWLHGLGADGHDFVPIVPELVRPHWPAIRFIFPHAPVRPVTINRGMEMRAWYDILSADVGGGREDAGGIAESVLAVNALIAREAERGIPPARVLLAGFSQGAAVALCCGLVQAEPLNGIVALSGYLPLLAATLGQATPAGLATPVFMAHGSHDPVVAQARGLASRDALAAAGVDVAWFSYPMPHSVCAAEISDLADWLEQRLAVAGS